jgi:hypothetical protein
MVVMSKGCPICGEIPRGGAHQHTIEEHLEAIPSKRGAVHLGTVLLGASAVLLLVLLLLLVRLMG